MFCTQCGRQNPEGNRFCAGCGATLRSIPKPAQRSSKALWIAGGSSFLVLAIALLVWLTGTPSEQVIIDVSGGTQQFPKSGVQLEIPPGATQKSVSAKLNVVSTPPTPPEGASLLGSAYDIRSEVAAFDEPVRLSIPVPSDKWPIAPGELVTVATWNEELRDWVPLGSELDEQQKTVSTWVTHFSTYAVINWNPQKPNAVATRTTQHFHVVGLSKPFSEDPEQFTKYVQRLTPLVERVAELLEEAWSLVIDQLGYREPRLRARDKRIWVWITPLVKRDWAGFVDEPPKTLARSLPDMNIYLSPQLDKETPLHEFFHIVQIQSYLNRYRYEPAAEWWMEATSAWVQTKVQDASKIYRKYYSLTKTELLKHSLDDSGEIDDAREYLAGVFASYLESLFGTEVIRRTWEIISAQVQAGQTANPLKAIESALSERGASLSDIYFNFALDYAYFRTSPWLGFLPAFKTEEVEASASQQTKTFSLPYMTCQFNRLTARRDTGTLKVAANADASIRYAIIDEPSKNVVHPSAGAAIQVAGFGATTKSAVLIACNTSLRGKGEFQLNYTVAREVVQPSREGISIGYVNEQAIGGISIDQLRARLKGMSGEKPDLVLKRQNVVLFANHTKVVDLTQAVRSQANIVVPMSPLRKIAYINAERVFQDYRKTSEFVQTFRVEAERMQQELKALQDRFKRGLISENTFQQEAARLQQELQRLDHQLTSEIQGDMIKAIEQIAQEGGIDWVTQRKDVVLFANPEVVIDLTDLVTRKLNGEQIESGLAALPPVELLKKVGYVRTSVVLSQYEETEVIQQLRADLEKKRQELRDMFKVLQDRFRRGLLSEDEFQRQGTRIQQELQRLDLEFTGRVQDDTHQAIAELAKRENYDLTLNDEVVLFVNETKIIDLTEQVLSYLRAKSKINTPTRSQGYPPQVISVDVPSQIPPETPISISVSFADPDGDVNTVEILDCSLTFLLLEQEPKCPRVMDNSPLQSANVKGVTSGVIKITLKCMLFPYGAKRKQKIILYDDKGLSSAPFEFTFECAKEQTPKGTNSTTLTVCPSGCAFSRIQDAINVATPGATIEIGPGTYYENLEITNSITLKGAGPDQTKILGREVDKPVILFTHESVSEIQVALKGLTIAEARGERCPILPTQCAVGVVFHGSMQASLEQVRVLSNQKHGVVVMADLVQLQIVRSEILNNGDDGVSASGNNMRLEIRESRLWGNLGCGISVGFPQTEVRGAPNEMGNNGADLCGFSPAWLRQPLTSQTDQLLLRVPQDFSNLQAAVDAVAPGGTILIQPGHFNAGLTVWKSLTLQGAGTNETILTGLSRQAPVVSVIAQVQHVTLKDLTLTRGGTGIAIKGKTQTVLESLEISNNQIWGLSIAYSANTSILNARISQNELGGIFVSLDAILNVQNSIIEENGTDARCLYMMIRCAGIFILGSPQVAITDSVIRNNADWGIGSYHKACGESTDEGVPTVVFEGQNVVTGNNRTGKHNGQGNPGNHPWNRPEVPDGQVCLP